MCFFKWLFKTFVIRRVWNAFNEVSFEMNNFLKVYWETYCICADQCTYYSKVLVLFYSHPKNITSRDTNPFNEQKFKNPATVSLLDRPGWVEDKGGRAGAAGALEWVKLKVDLGEAGGQDGGAHVVFPAQAHAPRQEVVPGRLRSQICRSQCVFMPAWNSRVITAWGLPILELRRMSTVVFARL